MKVPTCDLYIYILYAYDLYGRTYLYLIKHLCMGLCELLRVYVCRHRCMRKLQTASSQNGRNETQGDHKILWSVYRLIPWSILYCGICKRPKSPK